MRGRSISLCTRHARLSMCQHALPDWLYTRQRMLMHKRAPVLANNRSPAFLYFPEPHSWGNYFGFSLSLSLSFLLLCCSCSLFFASPATMDLPWSTVLFALGEPWHLMLETLTFIPQTLMAAVGHGHLSVLTHWHAFQDAWFANVWAVLGPRIAEGGAPLVSELLSRAHGVVLDIGPGAGNWVHLYPNANARAIRKDGAGAGGSAAASSSSSSSSTTTTTTTTTPPPAVVKIYGIEPNLQHHASLRRKVKEAGLDGVYEVVGAGAEELGRLGLGIGKGTVDTVVTTQVMCSVPGPERLVTELYGYLKPGGVWIVYEHVKTKETGWVEWYQGVFLLWSCSFFFPLFFPLYRV
jgi:SAM-dependent methyltransferase